MFLARVTGSLVSTQKVDSMVGQKLLVVEPLRIQEQMVDGRAESQLVSTGRTFISVDTVGAGEGQVVLIVQGSSARFTPSTKPLPIDCAIIGLIDVVQIQGKIVFSTRLADQSSATEESRS
ncbi:Ethanolamine utilization protein EutN/carboxysome structural protein Ccml [Planctopirus limnophila DSM 3776]|uniref:Ethanolamine utilization protein EutN/carboxysome structural protein Ccml n=1 Tax=Planctopirus limnophila (strain ATCC 43296 / DSM 3776 / IFAM 1008 / Mu 290) TaxID=521674 RepID=D5SXL6_PLAL2|nr:EutN/CcmL family microcompartment protein [Planctopirus limnophila]ADG67583.1 Ethanolamine utilization protein EutN/carboxysome structural protein Ccml [Planctopirus limnophila DSM 3776]